MPANHDESLLRSAFAPARSLEPNANEVAAVLARASSPSRRSRRGADGGIRRIAALALIALSVLGAGAYSVPLTRAAIDELTGSVADVLEGWTGEDPSDPPGRALRADERAPAYFDDGNWSRLHIREPRVIAQAGSYKLYAYRDRGGTIGFDLGDTGVGMGGFAPADFERRPLYLLGHGSMRAPDKNGDVPWFGLTAPSVTNVELSYESGPPLRIESVESGFVLLGKVARGPREVIARDADGDVVGRSKTHFAVAALNAISAAAGGRPGDGSP